MDEQGTRCGHNFPPDECPHEDCGFKRTLAELSESQARECRLREALEQNKRGYQNILSLRKIFTPISKNVYLPIEGDPVGEVSVRYGALTREEIDAVIGQIDAALLSTRAMPCRHQQQNEELTIVLDAALTSVAPVGYTLEQQEGYAKALRDVAKRASFDSRRKIVRAHDDRVCAEKDATIAELKATIDDAEAAIDANKTLADWKSDPNPKTHHASRVRLLCNLYADAVQTMQQDRRRTGNLLEQIEALSAATEYFFSNLSKSLEKSDDNPWTITLPREVGYKSHEELCKGAALASDILYARDVRVFTEKDSQLADRDSQLADRDSQLAKKDSQIREMETKITRELETVVAMLKKLAEARASKLEADSEFAKLVVERDQLRDKVDALAEIVVQSRETVALLYDRWRKGDDCYRKDPDGLSTYLGQGVKLSADEERRVTDLLTTLNLDARHKLSETITKESERVFKNLDAATSRRALNEAAEDVEALVKDFKEKCATQPNYYHDETVSEKFSRRWLDFAEWLRDRAKKTI